MLSQWFSPLEYDILQLQGERLQLFGTVRKNGKRECYRLCGLQKNVKAREKGREM